MLFQNRFCKLIKMQDYQTYFKDKKITMMGLGLLGRGIKVARFLAQQGADLTITDLKDKQALVPALAELKEFKQIKYVLGEHQLKDFKDQDMVIKAAGVPLNSEYIQEARKNQIPVEMDASLFVKLAPINLIGITGTRGKSTVTQMIYQGLKKYYSKNQVYLSGNIKGKASLPLLKQVKPEDWVVMELDSWQLQGFGDSQINPQISVFTNFLPDHLNYYQNDLKRYFQDKANIFKYQNKEAYLILTQQAKDQINKYYQKEIASQEILAEELPQDWQLKILGKHNRINASLAKQVLKLFDLTQQEIKESLENYQGEPGRLELVKTVNGIKYYNDTNATTPEACLAALNSFSQKVILIAGGADKELDFKKLVEQIPNKVKKLILIQGTGTEKIEKLISNDGYRVVESMQAAIQEANKQAQKGDIILLSPGAASFGVFKNEYDRGEQFNQIVKQINER